MRRKQTETKIDEGTQGSEEAAWAWKQETKKGRVIPLLPAIRGEERSFKSSIRQLIYTLGLVIVVVVPGLLFTFAQNNLSMFGVVTGIQTLGGLCGGVLFLLRGRKVFKTTLALPEASDQHQEGIDKAA